MEIDDSLYSRQRYMLGDKAMRALMQSNVLLFGCGGVGIEIAKNLVLTGVQSLTIVDDKVATIQDMGDNFYINTNDVSDKKSRSSICCPKLVELNPYVKVLTLFQSCFELKEDSQSVTMKLLSKYNCVVMTECTLEFQIKMNNLCRSITPQIKFISCDVLGLFASLFCDFGSNFYVSDPTGEDVKDIYITGITKDQDAKVLMKMVRKDRRNVDNTYFMFYTRRTEGNPGTVICSDAQMHGYCDGDQVVFQDIEGMTELNDQVHIAKVTSPNMFTIGDTSDYSSYVRNGVVRSIKAQKTVQFNSLAEQLSEPALMVSDFGKLEMPAVMHLALKAIHEYRAQHSGSWCEKSAGEVFNIARRMDPQLADSSQFAILNLAAYSRGCLPPLCSVVGGFAAQEVLKAVTGKYMPLHQWLFLDALNLLPAKDTGRCSPPSAQNSISATPGDRYDDLRRCLGSGLVNKLHRTRAFMVGCGAIGCEMLKNFALLGMSTQGKITVTDNDLIEKSNLNRQFLFRSYHIQKSKSAVAASTAKELNPDLNIVPMQKAVGTETEHTHFDDDFFQEHDVIINALDNIAARRFMDSRCVSNRKPLIESGTSGPKGHVQVVVPHLTESYGSQHDPNEETIAFCTLRQFPNRTEHTIEWAKEKFYNVFGHGPEQFNKVLADFLEENPSKNNFFRYLEHHFDRYTHEMDCVARALTRWPGSWPECVATARCKFEKYFNHKPRQLLRSLPLDSKEMDGSPFWALPKRPPTPLNFDPEDAAHMFFITRSAYLHARVYGIDVPQLDSTEYKLGIEEGLRDAKLPKFKTDKVEVEVFLGESSPPRDPYASKSLSTLRQLTASQEKATITLRALNVQNFEKDDDSNGHVDYVTATSNLRAIMYGLTPYDRLQTKQVAGRIVPAISTTTSVVAGLATLQLLQVLKHQMSDDQSAIDSISQFRNSFLNCALPLLVCSEPAAAKRVTLRPGVSHTLWDRWDVHGSTSFTLGNFMQNIKDLCGLNVSAVTYDVKILYFNFMPTHQQRPLQRMTALMDAPPCGYVELIVWLESEDGITDDLEAPAVRYYFNATSE